MHGEYNALSGNLGRGHVVCGVDFTRHPRARLDRVYETQRDITFVRLVGRPQGRCDGSVRSIDPDHHDLLGSAPLGADAFRHDGAYLYRYLLPDMLSCNEYSGRSTRNGAGSSVLG
ncbi:Uncharacterised protein [Mycobacteroides abscessus subsp. abscessus]|nr:Uncharacterised protein [Mycobacteroides abscessus subsp. abscessus]